MTPSEISRLRHLALSQQSIMGRLDAEIPVLVDDPKGAPRVRIGLTGPSGKVKPPTKEERRHIGLFRSDEILKWLEGGAL